jgi:glc operon protein GlcG
MVEDSRAKVPVRVMTQELAERAARAAQAVAAKEGLTVSVAVVDESGNLVYFVRGDDASYITFETARGKAVAAAGFRRPTHEFQESFANNVASWTSLAGKLQLLAGPGGHPLTKDGYIIGGIGCGAHPGDFDERCSAAGAAAISS